MSEWKDGQLNEIAEIIMGQSPKGEDVNSFGKGVPLLNGPTEFGYSYPLPIQYSDSCKKIAPKGSILFCVRGSTTGKMNWANQNYGIGRGLASITHKKGESLNAFLKGIIDYNLPSLLVSATGSTFPNVSKDQINGLKISIPPLPEQKAIAHILGTLDEKIELNRQMNQTLEAMAQALFKSWFVDFDPVLDNAIVQGNEIPEELQGKAAKRRHVIAPARRGGSEERPKQSPNDKGIKQSQSLKPLLHTNPSLAAQFPASFVFNETLGKWIPEGWEVKKVEDIAMPRKGKNITKDTVVPGQVPVVAGGLEPSTYHNESNTNAPVITISASGANAGFVNLYHNPVWSSDSSFIDNTVTDHLFTMYLFLKGNQKIIFDMQEGSAQPHIYPRHIGSLEFCLAPKAILEKFELIMNGYFRKIKTSKAEIETLTQLRNRLLPELISGRVRVVKTK
ncbi:restriction endonuclease subunit S [Algoriphagus sp. CAU 1675]|uniref:restriction endonuclease subunit S n=1 Tax=Algoriphagus sp. CAU 1675 TaxID=3032597 RepID=UPI0023DC3347|nr:restriction endonuclease subunit S [Algoriphagus sp. CAU 1675]MDF2156481.1 restriction endonuclease subunit S [Algoriphagus sp. CAU 1675]